MSRSDLLFSTAVVRAALTSLRTSGRSDEEDGKSEAEQWRREEEEREKAESRSAVHLSEGLGMGE